MIGRLTILVSVSSLLMGAERVLHDDHSSKMAFAQIVLLEKPFDLKLVLAGCGKLATFDKESLAS
jgi:hypothetical protein